VAITAAQTIPLIVDGKSVRIATSLHPLHGFVPAVNARPA